MQRIPLRGSHPNAGITRVSINDRVGRLDETVETTKSAKTLVIPTTPTPTPSFVIYFHPRCKTSQEILGMFQRSPSNLVYLQNVVLLQQIPQWLNGTPILVDTNLGLLYKGSDAKQFVHNMCQLNNKQSTSSPQIQTLPSIPSSEQTSSASHLPKSTRGQETLVSINHEKLKPNSKSSMDDLFQMIEEHLPDDEHQQKKSKFSETQLQTQIKMREK